MRRGERRERGKREERERREGEKHIPNVITEA
jgi:hypothetical protein